MRDNKSWFVYMLLCDNKTFYIGITNHIQNRYLHHKNKQSKATKGFSHIELAYCEKYSNEHDVAMREKQLKGWGRAKKQMLIDGKLGINNCTGSTEALVADLDK